MPDCPTCRGKGKVKVKHELTKPCPDCYGTKTRPDGAVCKTCNKWGEVPTGEHKTELKLCKTCLGTGKVSEQWLTGWFLVRAGPATLGILGVGGALIFASLFYLDMLWLAAALTVVFFGGWAYAMYYFINTMPKNIGEISVANWFLMRSIPTTVTAAAIGWAVVWPAWVYFENRPVTVLLGLAVAVVWAIFMVMFIIRLPE